MRGTKQKRLFQTLKDNLCNALILSLPDGIEDFIVIATLEIKVSVVYSSKEASLEVEAIQGRERPAKRLHRLRPSEWKERR
ncbi:hypothetical protein Tco_1145489 [Tanacetum coccineum]